MTEKEFTEYYNLNSKKTFGYLYKRVNRIEDVEDILEESYLAVLKNLKEISSDNINKYLYGIIRNKLNDYLRNKYRIELKMRPWDDYEEILHNEIEANTKRKDKSSLIKELVNNLKEEEKELFHLKYIENKTNSDIAKLKNTTINNIKVRNNRLLKKLKKLWIEAL